jgi:DNA uptake protein ComE-like DNA-binding protein
VKKLASLLTFTKPERNGLIVLAVLVCSGILLLKTSMRPAENYSNLPLLELKSEKDKSDSFQKLRKDKPTTNYVNVAGGNSVFQQKELFFFDPNSISAEEWIRLGFSPEQTQSILNFRSKGGNFRKKEDLKKLYVVSPEKYAELESYITIPVDSSKAVVQSVKSVPEIIELNTADTSLLASLNGIGPVFAKRIVDYRLILGGFHHKEQLLEVYGLDKEKYALIEPKLKVDSTYIQKININQVSASELKRHPYFSPGVANGLVNYRKTHGMFQRLTDIMKCHLVNAELYRKIAPYLTI